MKPLRLTVTVLSSLLATACGSPQSIIHTVTEKTTFHAPTSIQAPMIAGDSPAQIWTFPKNPASVIQHLAKWLSTASITSARPPKTNQNVQFADYIGPAQLYFYDESGHRILVEPAYSIAHKRTGYEVALLKNIVEYHDGNHVTYLKAPQLFHWLSADKYWGAQFREESSTTSEQKAITDAKESKWGGHPTSIFPALPGINRREIKRSASEQSKQGKAIPVTVESIADPSGANIKVTFIEVWQNGKRQHKWIYTVSAKGKVTSHAQSGDAVPT